MAFPSLWCPSSRLRVVSGTRRLRTAACPWNLGSAPGCERASQWLKFLLHVGVDVPQLAPCVFGFPLPLCAVLERRGTPFR